MYCSLDFFAVCVAPLFVLYGCVIPFVPAVSLIILIIKLNTAMIAGISIANKITPSIMSLYVFAFWVLFLFYLFEPYVRRECHEQITHDEILS